MNRMNKWFGLVPFLNAYQEKNVLFGISGLTHSLLL